MDINLQPFLDSCVSPFYHFFSNDFVLFILGAGVTSLLIPYLTRKWQEHQEELKLKIELVEEIGKTVTTIVMAVESFEEQKSKKQNSKTNGETN